MRYAVGPSSLSKVKNFFFFQSQKGERGCVFTTIPEKEILDFIAQGSIIQIFTVVPAIDKRLVAGRRNDPGHQNLA